jgi:hypothetical protein
LARRDPLTGIVLPTIADLNLHNAYSITSE